MRHRNARKKLGRNASHRKAMMRNLVTSFFLHEQLETTDTKAKELKKSAEKMITLAKRGDLHARRQAMSYIKDKAVTHRLFEELKDRFMDRQGGYVRIIKKGPRKGDGAPISIIQLLPPDEGKKKGKKKAKGKASAGETTPKKKKEVKAPEEKSPESETVKKDTDPKEADDGVDPKKET
jgi:large subunit ribosomal protein L17